MDIHRKIYISRYISPTGGAANVPFIPRRGKMHKRASLSTPPSRI